MFEIIRTHMYKVAQKSLDAALLLLNFDCKVAFAPPCIKLNFLKSYCVYVKYNE